MSSQKTDAQLTGEKILEAARKKEITEALNSGKTPTPAMLDDALRIYGDQKTAKRIVDRMKLDPVVAPLQQTFAYAAQFLGETWVKDLSAAAAKATPAVQGKAGVRRTPRTSSPS